MHIQSLKHCTDDSEMADIMNKYFTSVGDRLASVFEVPDPSNFMPNTPPTYNLQPTNQSTVDRLIRELKGPKACGLDRVTYRLLKDAGQGIVGPLIHIMNLSIATSAFPSTRKVGLVTPIHKDGPTEDPNNY